MKKIITILVIAACSQALAEIVPVGGPQEGGSWEQRFREISSAPIDLLGVRMVSVDSAFKTPAYNEFSDATWSLVFDGPDIASATGYGLQELEWDLHFSGSPDDPLAFDYYVFSGNELVSSARCVWTSGASAFMWVIDYGGAVPMDDPNPEFIPAPGAALLGAIGLLGLRWAKRHAA